MIEEEIQKIDSLLDQKIQWVQSLLQSKRNLDYSLINNDLVHLYNEMLTLSYSLKLWLLSGFLSVSEHSEERLIIVKDQFENILRSIGHEESSKYEKTISMRSIQPYQQFNQAI